jgi:glucose/arabinose dehydrogenase
MGLVMTRLLIFSLLFLISWDISFAQENHAAKILKTEQHMIQVRPIVKGFEHPWGMAFLPDGNILVTERPGRLRIVEQGVLRPDPISGIPEVIAQGQGGLLDVALHPNFSENQLVYLSYSAVGEGGVGTEVARGRLLDNKLHNVETIFKMEPKSRSRHHFGSRLVFDQSGYLFITLGDRGQRERAQDVSDHAGSVIRIHDDGKIPNDNPYYKNPNWRPEVFSIGHRNMQGAFLHPLENRLWTHEHGPQGGDEINIIRKGLNYGWPIITYGVNYVIGTKIGEGTHKSGMEQPLYYWVPSIAPSGMIYYTGKVFPNWKGDLFVGALKDKMIVRLTLKDNEVSHEERFMQREFGRIRDLEQGPDGFIYFLTDEDEGLLGVIEPVE